jgi:hypothetical protein
MKEFAILKETFIYNCENVGIKPIPNAVENSFLTLFEG